MQRNSFTHNTIRELCTCSVYVNAMASEDNERTCRDYSFSQKFQRQVVTLVSRKNVSRISEISECNGEITFSRDVKFWFNCPSNTLVFTCRSNTLNSEREFSIDVNRIGEFRLFVHRKILSSGILTCTDENIQTITISYLYYVIYKVFRNFIKIVMEHVIMTVVIILIKLQYDLRKYSNDYHFVFI